MSKISWSVGVAGAVACALFWTGCSDIGAKKSAEVQEKPAAAGKPAQFNLDAAVGKSAPAFSLKDADGQTVHFADYRGKVVLLDFWATWCGPCKVEIPWFMDFENEFKDRGFAVLGVSMDEDGWKAIKPYMQNMKMNYRVLLGDDDVSTAYGGLDSLPTTLLIDRQGRIASVHVGITMGKKEFEDAISKLLSEPVTNASVTGHLDGSLARLRSPNGR
ncbi:MAG TPA: redoxin domain-containing protein [Bryobacteraceae bacterium]|nr:redoxin domain-containing protein [Bryobacteraceae bacterium]